MGAAAAASILDPSGKSAITQGKAHHQRCLSDFAATDPLQVACKAALPPGFDGLQMDTTSGEADGRTMTGATEPRWSAPGTMCSGDLSERWPFTGPLSALPEGTTLAVLKQLRMRQVPEAQPMHQRERRLSWAPPSEATQPLPDPLRPLRDSANAAQEPPGRLASVGAKQERSNPACVHPSGASTAREALGSRLHPTSSSGHSMQHQHQPTGSTSARENASPGCHGHGAAHHAHAGSSSTLTPLANNSRTNVHRLLQHHTLDLFAQANASACGVTGVHATTAPAASAPLVTLGRCQSPEVAVLGVLRDATRSSSGDPSCALTALSQELKRLTWLGCGGCGVVFKGEWKGAPVGEWRAGRATHGSWGAWTPPSPLWGAACMHTDDAPWREAGHTRPAGGQACAAALQSAWLYWARSFSPARIHRCLRPCRVPCTVLPRSGQVCVVQVGPRAERACAGGELQQDAQPPQLRPHLPGEQAGRQAGNEERGAESLGKAMHAAPVRCYALLCALLVSCPPPSVRQTDTVA